jgi:hypothetical protein
MSLKSFLPRILTNTLTVVMLFLPMTSLVHAASETAPTIVSGNLDALQDRLNKMMIEIIEQLGYGPKDFTPRTPLPKIELKPIPANKEYEGYAEATINLYRNKIILAALEPQNEAQEKELKSTLAHEIGHWIFGELLLQAGVLNPYSYMMYTQILQIELYPQIKKMIGERIQNLITRMNKRLAKYDKNFEENFYNEILGANYFDRKSQESEEKTFATTRHIIWKMVDFQIADQLAALLEAEKWLDSRGDGSANDRQEIASLSRDLENVRAPLADISNLVEAYKQAREYPNENAIQIQSEDNFISSFVRGMSEVFADFAAILFLKDRDVVHNAFYNSHFSSGKLAKTEHQIKAIAARARTYDTGKKADEFLMDEEHYRHEPVGSVLTEILEKNPQITARQALELLFKTTVIHSSSSAFKSKSAFYQFCSILLGKSAKPTVINNNRDASKILRREAKRL